MHRGVEKQELKFKKSPMQWHFPQWAKFHLQEKHTNNTPSTMGVTKTYVVTLANICWFILVKKRTNRQIFTVWVIFIVSMCLTCEGRCTAESSATGSSQRHFGHLSTGESWAKLHANKQTFNTICLCLFTMIQWYLSLKRTSHGGRAPGS